MAGSNNFQVFDENNTNVLSDADYTADTQRQAGVIPGMAKSNLHNKLFRQVSIMTSAIGEFIKNVGNAASDGDFTALVQAITNSFADKPSFTNHVSAIASSAQLAHIKIGTGLSIDATGKTTAVKQKTMSFTWDASSPSGYQSVTGVGFKPRSASIVACIASSTGAFSVGFDDGITPRCINDLSSVTANQYYPRSQSINLQQGASNAYTGNISSWDVDGFTINWQKYGTTSGIISVVIHLFE